MVFMRGFIASSSKGMEMGRRWGKKDREFFQLGLCIFVVFQLYEERII